MGRREEDYLNLYYKFIYVTFPAIFLIKFSRFLSFFPKNEEQKAKILAKTDYENSLQLLRKKKEM